MTSPAPSGGPSPLRVGGLALLGVAVVAALIGLAMLVTGNGGDGGNQAGGPTPGVTGTPAPGTPGAPGPTTGELPPTTAPGTGPDGVPVPSFGPTPTNGIAAPPADGSAGPGGSGTGGSGTGGTGADGSGGSGAGGAGAGGAGAGGAGAGGAGSGGTGSGGTGSGGSGSAGSGSGGGSGATAVRAPLRVYNNSTITGLASRAAEDFRAAGWTVEEVANYPFGIIPTTTVYFRPGTGEEPPANTLGAETGIRVQPRFEGLEQATPGLIVIVTNDYQA